MIRFISKFFTRQPDNVKLRALIKKWWTNRSDGNYKLVINELLHGNCFLIIPSLSNAEEPVFSVEWTICDGKVGIQVTSIRYVDGLKAIAVFTDEQSLFNWAKKPVFYIAIRANAVLDICLKYKIDRIVINSGSPNIFAINRNLNLD